MRLLPLPVSVERAVEAYYANPVKIGEDGRRYDVRESSPTISELKVLAQLILASVPRVSLEIGLGNGGSAIAIAAARKYLGLREKHMALDPYETERSGSVGIAELCNMELRDCVIWIGERSEVFLPAAFARGEKWDFVFVDSGMDVGQAMVDAYYIHRVLRTGGLVVFHDGLWAWRASAVRYLIDACGYKAVTLPRDS